jgi:hypothetical protein
MGRAASTHSTTYNNILTLRIKTLLTNMELCEYESRESTLVEKIA